MSIFAIFKELCLVILVAEEEDDRRGDDRMDEMLDAIRLELETNSEDPSTPEVQKFFDILRALEESLHEHTTVSVLTFVTHLTTIKSKFAFSNKYYKVLLSLISNVLPNNHKMPRDMYQSKKCCLLSGAINLDSGKLSGVKSHDYHIFMKRLLPIMFRGYLNDDVWKALVELSHFYRQFYAKKIKNEMMEKLEKEIPVLIYKLEKIFPPGWFNLI
jgi:hypothetical protein